jgi:hypothetical protein
LRRVTEADPHQMEREEPIVDPGKGRPPHHHPIDLEALAADVVEERFEQLIGMAPVMDTGVDEIHAEASEGILLACVARIEHPDVNDDVVRLAAGLVLEADPHPGMPVIAAGVGFRGSGVGEGEEPRARAARFLEPLSEEGKLVLEHLLDALP